MYQGRHGGDCDEYEVYPPERSEGGIHTIHIATMPLYAQACNATFSARLDTKIFVLLGNLPSNIVDSRKCLQLNLRDVTLSPNFIR